ncbi:DNA polymerase-3 subunit epsilon [Cyclonatronum proteinivorum]|uniref:DNA polymerase-3 subunit epsilon n=1 Tax=Cyclonatronum proteinivorum TaxID=1457365 RepID=A0A345ULS8_9BACT|nr:exonuclease domain-containing protein [Cyclonatronum proteinivorum]AXJ01430.1 DNA polymerase-3 subunit epsilon [Cyclonatronum proteinivorum]
MNRNEQRLFSIYFFSGFAVILVSVSLFAVLLWKFELVRAEGGSLIWTMLLLVALLSGAHFAGLKLFFTNMLEPLNRLNDALQAFEAGRELELRGSTFTRNLITSINRLNRAYRELKQTTDARIADANEKLEREKRTLATLISELHSGVILCSGEGRIILYNPVIEEMAADAQVRARLGLGKDIRGLFDAGLVDYLFEESRGLLASGSKALSAAVSYAPSGDLVRLSLIPVSTTDADGGEAWLLIMRNIAPEMRQAAGRDTLLKQLSEQVRASVASIRAAGENLSEYPDMPAAMRQNFVSVIEDEAGRLGSRVGEVLGEYEETYRSYWPKEPVLLRAFLENFAQRAAKLTGLDVRLPDQMQTGMIRVDTYALLLTLLDLQTRVSEALSAKEVQLQITDRDKLTELRLLTPGVLKERNEQLLESWLEAKPSLAGSAHPVSSGEILDRHDAEIWIKTNRELSDAPQTELCLVLPFEHSAAPETSAPSEAAAADAKMAAGSRPVYYDFELFLQSKTSPELADAKLSELSFTVFDLETTGLNPSVGDEIISFGGIRILNNKLLTHDTFDALCKPARPVSPESTAIHGITNEMLAGKPPVTEILPAFHAWCENSVLVGHNIAFDLRFLKLLEKRSGLVFNQPALDTLLLSSVLFPDAEAHGLETLCAKFGITVKGRHSALGDAIATAEVFAYLIPLLADRGITTLAQARDLSKDSHFTMLKY